MFEVKKKGQKKSWCKDKAILYIIHLDSSYFYKKSMQLHYSERASDLLLILVFLNVYPGTTLVSWTIF